MPDKEDIFLSYSRTDKVTAETVVEAFRAAGLGVWWDADIPLTRRWQQVLEEKLSECTVFVVLIGMSGVSGWVSAEVETALDRAFSRKSTDQFPIVPVLLGDVDDEVVPKFLARFQVYRLQQYNDRAGVAALATRLRDDLASHFEATDVVVDPDFCPFPGLAPFDESRQAFFLGRHADVYEALKRFSKPIGGLPRRWLRIEGNSGLGKSSLLKAGIVPALKQGWMDLGEPDNHLSFLGSLRPGRAPLKELAALLARSFRLRTEEMFNRLKDPDFELAFLFAEQYSEESRELPLLVVDQFEELFTLSGEQGEERSRFDQLLASGISDDRHPLYLITTLRSDFLGQFDTVPRLNSLRDMAALFELLPVGELGLRDVVGKTVAMAGLRYSDGELAEEIVQEALHEPGALPLVSNLLRLLWEDPDRRESELQRATYTKLGGLGGALARSSDDLLDSLGGQGRDKGLRLLLNLVQPGINTPHARRSISRVQALASVGGDEDVLNRLSGLNPDHGRDTRPGRLVLVSPGRPGDQDLYTLEDESTGPRPVENSISVEASRDADRIDLIHETLLRTRADGTPYWPTLWEEIEQTDFLKTRARLEQQAQAWHDMPHIVPLARHRELSLFEGHRPGADGTTLEYLDACAAGRRRIRRAYRAAAVVLAAIAVYGLWRNDYQLARSIIESAYIPVATVRARLDRPALPTLVHLFGGEASDPCFEMGSSTSTESDEKPEREVCVRPGISITAHEVTFDEYDSYALLQGLQLTDDYDFGRGPRPVIGVSWREADSYAKWLSGRLAPEERIACSLPTESEWEYAARAGTTTAYAVPASGGGESIAGTNLANCDGCGSEWDDTSTAPVGSFPANAWGLYDMHGNVWEWVQDCWHENYNDAPKDGSAWLEENGGDCSRRVLRGGSWFNDPDFLRSAGRFRFYPGYRNYGVGFRVVCRPH